MLSPTHESMSPDERYSGLILSFVFALRMLGLFLILPVFAVMRGSCRRGMTSCWSAWRWAPTG